MTGTYRLPWVRLHGTKDYLDMVMILDNYERVKLNFNLVPSLLEQLEEYISGNVRDVFLDLTLKEPEYLDESERIFILNNFFLANYETMIKPFSRYYELLLKRGLRFSEEGLRRISRYFTHSDIRDLQVLFNLVWIDPSLRRKDKELMELVRKAMDYSEDDKRLVIMKQFEILRRIIPKYKEVLDRGQIEISFSPFYHPILPLLIDTDSARRAISDIKLPSRRFVHPEDAELQVRKGREYIERVFSYRPSGMWPSEGSLSPEVIDICREEGLEWIATDEGVLSRSIDIPLRSGDLLRHPEILYRPYEFNGVNIFFRDHQLSDLIGFVYSKWDPKSGADDLVGRLRVIKEKLDDRPYIVSIILDGENAWEYYRDDGDEFLNHLYQMLSNQDDIKTVTFSECLELIKSERLSRLHSGSWINADFRIWIGHEEDNLAWDYLEETRSELRRYEIENPGVDTMEAWKSIYIAEGSDWNWWYGDEHHTDTQKEFDELFRNNLINVYRLIDKEPPSHLFVPLLKKDRKIEPMVDIRGFIKPKIDGYVSNYFEWLNAAYFEGTSMGGSMHRMEGIIGRIYYGFDRDNLYIRLDPYKGFDFVNGDYSIVIDFTTHPFYRVVYNVSENKGSLLVKKDDEFHLKELESDLRDIFEIGIPFEYISAKENDVVGFIIFIMKADEIIERHPSKGIVMITVPTPYFESMMWY